MWARRSRLSQVSVSVSVSGVLLAEVCCTRCGFGLGQMYQILSSQLARSVNQFYLKLNSCSVQLQLDLVLVGGLLYQIWI
jgi:hypothetical protein